MVGFRLLWFSEPTREWPPPNPPHDPNIREENIRPFTMLRVTEYCLRFIMNTHIKDFARSIKGHGCRPSSSATEIKQAEKNNNWTRVANKFPSRHPTAYETQTI
jgi:hypothetical protein